MTRFHYVTVPMEQVFDAARLCTEPDSYIAEDRESKEIRDLLFKGYRWVRTDCGFAVFEKEITFKGAECPTTKKEKVE